MNIDRELKDLGYCGLFADRKDMAEAMEYLNMVAKASENPAAVVTAAWVLLNTYIKTTHEAGMLKLPQEEAK